MRRLLVPLAAAMAALPGCGGSGGDLGITVTAPPVGGAVADGSYIVAWDAENVSSPDAYVNVYADTDTDPSTGLVLLEDSISTTATGYLWDCSDWPADDYYIRAVVHDYEDEDASDYSDGPVTVTHEPLENVTGLKVLADSSDGTEVYLHWNPLFGASAYRVFFDADSVGDWLLLGETEAARYVHDAPGAGVYGVLGVRNGETSPGFGSVAGTMPYVDDSVYTVWDDLSPEGSPTAVRFSPCGAYLSGYDEDDYDVYCRRAGESGPVHLFSGDAPPIGNGYPTAMALSAGSPSVAPASGYADSLPPAEGDVLFGRMELAGFFVKMVVTGLPLHPTEPGCRGVSFRYEFQKIQGLRLFTSGS
ncbi:MAG TPA: hypothetical protein PKH86_08095 [Candidatus Fermentibacter daniensis]|mgnify:CR=1 FL=1|nr:hypothetical protein [Candidatus Fermentibacter daniensis]HOG55626.1 hypothetical protein [Candidatus Fermentibacter daniensis]